MSKSNIVSAFVSVSALSLVIFIMAVMSSALIGMKTATSNNFAVSHTPAVH